MLDQRVVRDFISSTFRDMKEERDYLVKYTFPQLRAFCESRGLAWGEVDLRWGITDEEKAEGKMLPLCLEEIANCRPFFIGILGEIYGWIPDGIPDDLIEKEPWLQEHRTCSVTELEILHGALNNPAIASHAFFYFRDAYYPSSLSHENRLYFEESILPEDVARIGYEAAKLKVEERKGKLAVLKKRIRQSGFPVRENLINAKQLGEMVLRDMIEVINLLAPEGTTSDPLAIEASSHSHFAKDRSRLHIGREELLDRLDNHAEGNFQPLAVTGVSGCGKSALLSKWALDYGQKHPDELLILHFVGATPESTNWIMLVQRVLGELKNHFAINLDIPKESEELKSALSEWLYIASTKGKVIIVLDGLDHLEDKEEALDLVCIPTYVPVEVRMIVTTAPGKSFDEIRKSESSGTLLTMLNCPAIVKRCDQEDR